MKIDSPRSFLIDFDGTVCLHEYPRVGPEIPGCVDVLKKLTKAGHFIILFTMRADEQLNDAVAWFKARGIKLFAVNCNSMFETGSRKIYGHVSIDDHNLNIPLVHNYIIHPKPFVDWSTVDKILEERGYYIQQHVAQEPVQS